MFTGIIQECGRIVSKKRSRKGARLVVECPPRFLAHLKIGSSVACDGVCLTLAGRTRKTMEFDLLSETLARTTFGSRKAGDLINLERALRAGDELGGHLVQGHVDGVGVVRLCKKRGGAMVCDVTLPPSLRTCVVPQGSIAVNGVSLTIVRVSGRLATVSLIPFTLQHTNLGSLVKGARVNIEVDILQKYIHSSGITSGGGFF